MWLSYWFSEDIPLPLRIHETNGIFTHMKTIKINQTQVFQYPPNTLWGSVFGPPKGRTSGDVKLGPNTDPHKVFGRLGKCRWIYRSSHGSYGIAMLGNTYSKPGVRQGSRWSSIPCPSLYTTLSLRCPCFKRQNGRRDGKYGNVTSHETYMF